jgi:hypothetical protein
MSCCRRPDALGYDFRHPFRDEVLFFQRHTESQEVVTQVFAHHDADGPPEMPTVSSAVGINVQRCRLITSENGPYGMNVVAKIVDCQLPARDTALGRGHGALSLGRSRDGVLEASREAHQLIFPAVKLSECPPAKKPPTTSFRPPEGMCPDLPNFLGGRRPGLHRGHDDFAWRLPRVGHRAFRLCPITILWIAQRPDMPTQKGRKP